MKSTFLALATTLAFQFVAISSPSFASQLPDAPTEPGTLSQYENCLALEESGIIPFIPCYLLKKVEDAAVPEETEENVTAPSQYEHCLALEAKGIIPFIPCYLIKKIEDAQTEN